jgi:hypothetical protein
MAQRFKITFLRSIASFYFIFLLFPPVFCKAGTVFSSNCQLSFFEILHLNFQKANVFLEREQELNPNNLYIPYLSNYIEFLKVALNESPTDYSGYIKQSIQRLKKIEQSKENTYNRLCFLGEINLQSSIIYAKYNEKFKALKYLYAAQKNILECQKKFPEANQVNKLRAVVIQINSYLPQIVKNFVPASLQSSEAFQVLESYKQQVHSDTVLSLECKILSAFFKHQFSENPKSAYNEVKPLLLEHANNPLLNLAFSFIAMRNGKSAEALTIINRNVDAGLDTFQLYKQYVLGVLNLNTQLDGKYYLTNFLKYYQGNTYRKSAWLKLGWSYYLQGDTQRFIFCRKQVMDVGTAWNDADAAALFEAKETGYPNIYLLKARVLFDGGLYNKSRSILATKEALASLQSKRDQIEYLYRFARINHAEGDLNAAKKYYAQVITMGKTEPYYFAANSALQLGLLFEKEENHTQASSYFQLCLSINKYGYSGSIGAKAHAGLKRVTQ